MSRVPRPSSKMDGPKLSGRVERRRIEFLSAMQASVSCNPVFSEEINRTTSAQMGFGQV